MIFKAVFFDFDYTLADGTEAIVAGFRYAFGRMGLPEPTEEAIRPTIGMVLEDEFTFLSGEADPPAGQSSGSSTPRRPAPCMCPSPGCFPVRWSCSPP